MESLIRVQNNSKTLIEKAYKNYKKSPKERLTENYIKTKLESLEQLWQTYFVNHQKITQLASDSDLSSNEYLSEDSFSVCEESYTMYKCELKDALLKFNAFCVVPQSHSNERSSELHNIKLPKLEIPKFTGSYSEWTTFKDLYSSLIHNNASLDSVQKMQYLKSYLDGEAAQLLKHVTVSANNYEAAWTTLLNRYSNKKYLATCLLRRFMSQANATESAKSIKDLLDTTVDCLNGLKNLGIDTESWDIIVIHIISSKLSTESRLKWESLICTVDALPTLVQFKEFLHGRFRSLEFLDYKSPSISNSVSNKPRAFHVISNANVSDNARFSNDVKMIPCPFCGKGIVSEATCHKLSNCELFCKENFETRYNFVKSSGRCFACLGLHKIAFCRMSNNLCRICKRKHHSLLHPPKPPSNSDSADETSLEADISETVSAVKASLSEQASSSNVAVHFSKKTVSNQILLATALVDAHTRSGETLVMKALIDQGSQASFVTESAVQLLGLQKVPTRSTVSGLGGDNRTLASKYLVRINIQSRHDPTFTLQVNAIVLSTITTLLPAEKITTSSWSNLASIVLADPGFHTPAKVDILLGADVYGEIIRDGLLKSPKGIPTAQYTALGWILSGPTNQLNGDDDSSNAICNHNVIVSMHSQVNDNELLKKFWEIESDTFNKKKILSKEEEYCEEFYNRTTTRDPSGRYIVRLPFRENWPQIASINNSKTVALKRFHLLENRFKNNSGIKAKYVEVMQEYLDLGHMELIANSSDVDKVGAVYLPHHAVIREDKSTTKVRVVFDASSQDSRGVSLNSTLLVGPTIQQDLRHIILRWRLHPICLSADIIKMYRQVLVATEDTDFQRLLWRDNTASEVNHYRMLRVTFGTASAPYLAVKTLQRLSDDEGSKYPKVSEKVKTDFYVDDLMTGCETVEEGIRMYKDFKELLSKGGFELQKWVTNSKKLSEEIGSREKAKNLVGKIDIRMDEVIKVLGLSWDRESDSFHYAVKLSTQQKTITKRMVVSDVSRLFDPLGWAAPCILKAKVMIQKLWLAGIDWDEELPSELLSEWQTYRNELFEICGFNIPRWVETRKDNMLVELHGFCDASSVAYAAVIYIRTIHSDGGIRVNLVTAKTKVAPTMQVSIPRLELMGAQLLAKLMDEISETLSVSRSNVHGWTDSTVVLAWLSSHPSKWTTFVGNRTSEILSKMDNTQWAHVQSAHNPADIASRGVTPSELNQNVMWKQGPIFLHNREIEYSRPNSIVTEVEKRSVRVHTIYIKDSDVEFFMKYSTLQKLVRVVAYCRRFLKLKRNKLENKRFNTYLTAEEIGEAIDTCIKISQKGTFKQEIFDLQKSGIVSNKSKLKSLCPFLDKLGILRVSGRKQNAELEEAKKHPIILPSKCYITGLVVDEAHRKTLHGGPTLMLNYLRTRYWICSAKNLVKAFIRKCVICTRYKAAAQNQLMGQLPSSRVQPSRPFLHTGVDFAGPINMRLSKGRGNKSYKGYICIFVCMVTRAIHLEAVSDLTADGFIAGLKRMVARRGYCSDIWSDNGTNFVGASKEIHRLIAAEKSSVALEIQEWLGNNSITWHFIPPHAPNFGGLWEAAVKSTKFHLKRVIGESTLTYEEMATFLTQVEACLNSRPLYQLPSDADVSSLTPGHFLVGEPLIIIPERNYENSTISSLKRSQATQRMVQNFWRRWSNDYLNNCLQRYKWAKLMPEPKIGDVVLVKEDNLPPARWLLGKIINKHPGMDNVTRVATLKCNGSVIKRPISKLCILPISE